MRISPKQCSQQHKLKIYGNPDVELSNCDTGKMAVHELRRQALEMSSGHGRVEKGQTALLQLDLRLWSLNLSGRSKPLANHIIGHFFLPVKVSQVSFIR